MKTFLIAVFVLFFSMLNNTFCISPKHGISIRENSCKYLRPPIIQPNSPTVQFEKPFYCFGGGVLADTAVAIANCGSSTIEWYNGITPSFQSFISTDIQQRLIYGQTYSVRCVDITGVSDIVEVNSDQVPFYLKASRPNFTFDGANQLYNNQIVSICKGYPLFITASCDFGTLQWNSVIPTLDTLFYPTDTTHYTTFCEGRGGCNSDTLKASYNFIPLQYPNEIPTITNISKQDTISSCQKYLTIEASGCSSGIYDGYFFRNGNNWALNFQSVGTRNFAITGIDSSTTYKIRCRDLNCRNPLFDSVNVFIDQTLVILARPTIVSEKSTFCEGEGLTGISATGCTNGIVLWYQNDTRFPALV